MSRYTMDHWARAFELHKFPEIGDMKPSEMMRQMKALLPLDSPASTYFMAALLLCLPADMIDHIISQDFKDCNKMVEYTDKLYARRRGNTVTAINANHDSAINAVPAAAAGRARLTTDATAHRPTRGAAAGRHRAHTKTTVTSATTTPPTATRRGSTSLGASGSRETGWPPRTKYSRRRHDFFTG
jgi:hypothetical protein